ncbi:hypothetical protein Glove_495g41 [Diversispora epigaea]|uniref:Uncharacterized protein n=1 Tax=Diversispora epigaea TaxID=1348612 RepID=A0A397GLY0_9GLOM|nr:hypothetical protein Glove_495g41 [Diversispora epigaea]
MPASRPCFRIVLHCQRLLVTVPAQISLLGTEYLINHTFPPNGTNEQRRKLRQQANHYIVQDKILYKRNKVLI